MPLEPTPPSPMVARSSHPVTSTVTASSPRPFRGDCPSLPPDAQPDAVLAEIRSHLFEGSYGTAQSLAKAAASRFPEHPEICTMNRGLNDWRATTRPATGVDRTEEREWLRNPPESARGKWVALVGNEMVSSAHTLAEVVESLRSKHLPKRPLALRVE